MLNISHYKEALESERARIMLELATVGRINPSDPSDWEPVAETTDGETAEVEERATEIASFENRSPLEFEMEERLKRIDEALLRITQGTYGHCIACGADIDPARLDIVPEALTCRLHMN